MTVSDVVLAALRNRYVVLPRGGTEELAGEIARAVLEHLREKPEELES